MANLNNIKLLEAIALLKKDPKNQAVLFGRIHSPEWLLPLAKEGFFNQENLPDLIKTEQGFQLPFWAQLNYLKSLGDQVFEGKINNAETVVAILEILRGFTDLKGNFIVADGLFKVMMQIPVSMLTVSDVDLAFGWVTDTGGDSPNRVLERETRKSVLYLKKTASDNQHDRQILLQFFERLFQPQRRKLNESKYSDPGLRFFSDYELKEFRSTVLAQFEILNKPYISEVLLSAATKNLENILENDRVDDSSELWRPAIEDHHRNNFQNSAQAMLVEILFYTSKVLLENRRTFPELRSWQLSNYWTFRRIYLALYNSAEHISNPQEIANLILLWGIQSDIRHEGLQFLKKHFDSLNDVTRLKIIEAIDSIDDSYSVSSAENSRITAWAKLRWLSGIKQSEFSPAIEFRKKQLEFTNGSEPAHPDLQPSPEVWVGPISPFTQEELAKQSIDEIIQNLKTFESEEGFRGATVSGFARAIESYIPTDSSKCAKLINEFQNLKAEYVAAIIDGYRKAWSERVFVPVSEIIKEAQLLIDSEKFSLDLLTTKESKNYWVISSICNFSEEGTRDDENAFSKGIEIALIPLLKKMKELIPASEEYNNNWDAYTRAINEPRGKIFEAMILLALRRARMANDEPELVLQAWESLREDVEPILTLRNPKEISLYALVGSYYRQLMYLSESWVSANLELLCPKKEEYPNQWCAFMDGFSYVNAFVKPMYLFLRDRGDLLYYARLNLDKGNASFNKLQSRAYELSIVAYFLGYENLDGEFFNSIFLDKNPEEWGVVVTSSIGLINGPEKNQHLEKALSIVEKMISLNPWMDEIKKWRHFFLAVGRFVDFFEEPRHLFVKEIFKLVALGADGQWEFHELIDYMHAHIEEFPDVIADLFLILLRNSEFAPSWPSDKIRDIFISIKNQDPLKAMEVCRIYGERSFQAEPINDLCRI